MYILQLLYKANTIPGTRLGSTLLFSDPIFVSKEQPVDDIDRTRCACTYFREHAMEFTQVELAMQWIRSREAAGVKIAAMFEPVEK